MNRAEKREAPAVQLTDAEKRAVATEKRARLAALSERFGLAADPDAMVSDLSVAAIGKTKQTSQHN